MWRGDRRRWLRADLIAALSLWAVLVPQGLTYGELAGLAPVAGLYTALGAMVAYGLLGTSRYLNLGPESSVAILVASSLAPLAGGDPDRYAALAGLLAIMVGGLLLAGYLARLGVVTRLLSAPVLTGYLAGSAIVIIVFPGCPTPAWTTRCGCSAPPPASPCWSSRAASSAAVRWPPVTAKTWMPTASSSASAPPTWPPGCSRASRPTSTPRRPGARPG